MQSGLCMADIPKKKKKKKKKKKRVNGIKCVCHVSDDIYILTTKLTVIFFRRVPFNSPIPF